METVNRLALTFLLNALWQVTVVACVAALCGWLLHNAPARYRHAIWVMALGLAVLLPLASVRHNGVTISWRAQPAQADAQDNSANWKWQPAGRSSGPQSQTGRAAGKAATGPTAPTSGVDALWPRIRFIPFVPYLGFLALACYLVSLLFHARRLGQAWNATSEIRRAAFARPLPAGMALVAARCRASLGLAEIPILSSRLVCGPVTLGAAHPAIILPESLFQEASQADLTSIFAHEMAHIRRHDYAMNLLYRLLALPISFHPGAAFMMRRIGETREVACDEIAARVLASPTDYAHSLVALARRISVIARPGYTLGVFDANILEERIMRLLDQRSRLSAKWASGTLAIGAGLLGACCILASSFSLGVSQESKAAADDALKAFIGTWQGKRLGKTILKIVIREQDRKLTGEADFYHVTLDETGKPVEVDSVPSVSELTQPHVEGKTAMFSFQNPDGDAHQFSITLTGDGEARFEVIGAPPPPGQSAQSAPGLKLKRDAESGSETLDQLKPFVGAWEAKKLGKPYLLLSLSISDHTASGKVDIYGGRLDSAGKLVEVNDEAEECLITAAKAEATTAILSGVCPHMGKHDFELSLTGDQELVFKVVGVPPPPDENGESQPAVKLTGVPSAAAEVPAELAPFVGTWQANFAGHSFMTLTLSAVGEKLTGTMSPCRIELDASGKLTSAERSSGGGGWHIIDAKLDGSKLSVKAKEDESGDVDEFEMRVTSLSTAEFKPVGGPMAVQPWPMTRGDDKPVSHLDAPPPPPPPPPPQTFASLSEEARPAIAGKDLKGLDFSGRWELVKSKSDLPSPSPDNLVQQIEQHGSQLRISTSSKDWNTSQAIAATLFALMIQEVTITPDNLESVQKFGPGELVSRTHWEDGKLVTDWKLRRDGEEVMAGKWVRTLSPDGHTMTVQISASDSNSASGGAATLVFAKKSA